MAELSVLFRCNAGHAFGYGHVSRCLALARAFAFRGSSGISFALNSPEAVPLVKAKGYNAVVLNGADPDGDFVTVATERHPTIVVLDVRPSHSLEALRAIREKISLLAVLDDVSEQRLVADVIYLPPVPAVARADWTGFTGVKRVGLQWMLTGQSFTPPPYRKPVAPYRLLMTMGGGDPWGYTQRLAPVFAAICHEGKMPFGVVIGPGFAERDQQIAMVTRLPGPPLVFDNPADMGEVYGWCDAAVMPMCVSAYELARSAKPALYICPGPDYAEHAKVFEKAGFGGILAESEGKTSMQFREDLSLFIRHFLEMGRIDGLARETFVGNAADMVAEDMLDSLSREKGAR